MAIPKQIRDPLLKLDEFAAELIFGGDTISSALAQRMDTNTHGVHILMLEAARALPGWNILAGKMQETQARNAKQIGELDRALKYATPATRKRLRKRIGK